MITVINYNKKIQLEYNIDHRLECGVCLTGTEVKSIRLQNCSIQEASCSFIGHQLLIYNMNIPIYKKCFQNNHDPKRIRQLLIHKKQARKLIGLIKKNNWQIIPEKVFFNEKNLLKIIVAIGSHSKKIDKREKIKSKETKKEIQQLKIFTI